VISVITAIPAQDVQAAQDSLLHFAQYIPFHEIGGVGHLPGLKTSPEFLRSQAISLLKLSQGSVDPSQIALVPLYLMSQRPAQYIVQKSALKTSLI